MSNSIIPFKSFVMLSASALIISGCAYVGIGDPDPRWADYQSWTKINDRPITGDHSGILGNLHQGESGYRDIYVNDIGEETLLQESGPYNLPVGTVIVKEQYRSQSAWENNRWPGVTIMVKVEDSEHNQPTDWHWSRGYVREASEDEFCSACHTAAIQSDFSFVNGSTLDQFVMDSLENMD